MFVFAYPIIHRSQCWLFDLRANIRICLKYPYLSQISVFASNIRICPKYPYLPQISVFASNIRICPHIFVFATKFNFRYMCSGLKDYMSMYKQRWYIKLCIKSYFIQINLLPTFTVNV